MAFYTLIFTLIYGVRHIDNTCSRYTDLRLSMSALAGDPDPKLWVFNFLIAILGSVSQVPVNSQVPMGPQIYLQILMVLNGNNNNF